MDRPKPGATALEIDSRPQPAHPPPVTGMPEGDQRNGQQAQWSSDLCDCFSDLPVCCLTCWCPCITFGRIAEITDKGATPCAVSGAIYGLLRWFTGCSCLYSCLYRSKLRKQYMVEESPCNDCLVHCCCESCALCQEYRELKHLGFDMAAGWQETLPGPSGTVSSSAPVAPRGMTR
ncbi:hypothetical protein SADUNF_Sadunf11G0112900 [Salix dunnii]|uniref:Uncharacterized protein n=1 Tax=Salix dunnii TaxID=1413687 RepID=A0A835JMQ7_9ROSI|nr:hypothetical protein SADUNF_Sadunf11G0112900 [Salix dunnii]